MRSVHMVRVAFLITLAGLTSCGGSGGDAEVPVEPLEINLYGTWNVTFTPDQCPATVHQGLWTFTSSNGDLSTIGGGNLEMQSLGCPPNLNYNYSNVGVWRGWPMSIPEFLLLEMLNEHFQAGVFTVRVFSTNRIVCKKIRNRTERTSQNG